MRAPAFTTANATVYRGHCLAVLKEMPDQSVDCCVTSPPYWGLRDYSTASWEGGSVECNHKASDRKASTLGGGVAVIAAQEQGTRAWSVCGKCGARRIDAQLGLEPTPDEYVQKMVEVFREVRRVLRERGTLWLNLGDSYASGEVGRRDASTKNVGLAKAQKPRAERHIQQRSGLKAKDMVGIPWRVAFALQADGWYLRSDIIWAKPNPMPESVTDRPTKAHEYVFLLSKSARYYYDAAAIAEPIQSAERLDMLTKGTPRTGLAYMGQSSVQNNSVKDQRASWNGSRFDDGKNRINHPNVGRRDDAGRDGARVAARSVAPPPERGWDTAELLARGRNARTVWAIATQPYAEAHFATMPMELAERCIKAGTPIQVCTKCGVPRERITERPTGPTFAPLAIEGSGALPDGPGTHRNMGARYQKHLDEHPRKTTGWTDCGCGVEFRPGIVIDPFAGSGTTLAAARDLGRRAVGIELSQEYIRLIEKRVAQLGLGFGG